MTEQLSGRGARRRRAAAGAARAAAAQAATAAAPDPDQPSAVSDPPSPPSPPSPRRPTSRRARPGRDGDGALRDLVGGGSSQLGVSGALRGRDVNRPTAQDLARAERDVVIVRRNWTPPI